MELYSVVCDWIASYLLLSYSVLYSAATTIEDLKDSLLQVFHQQCPSEHTSRPHLSSDFTIDTFLPLKFLLQFLPPSLCSAMELLCTFMLSSGHIDKKPLLAMLMIRAYELHQVTAILHELKQHLSSSVIPLSSSSPSSHYLFSSSNTDDLDYDSELTHIFTPTSSVKLAYDWNGVITCISNHPSSHKTVY